MTLLDLARGPGMNLALSVFVLGVLWRLVGLALMQYKSSLAQARRSPANALSTGVAAMGMRSWPHREFINRTGYGEALGYSYHIGLFIVVLLFAPHIAFFKGLFGVSWPALPSTWISIISILTLTLFLAVLVRRITQKAIRAISNFDDYFSWFVTFLAMITGVLAKSHMLIDYETMLGLHLLSVELLLIWYPFGKLMHAFFIFPSRMANGYTLSRKGAPSW
jgi:nitrate reductase gamma subunit